MDETHQKTPKQLLNDVINRSLSRNRARELWEQTAVEKGPKEFLEADKRLAECDREEDIVLEVLVNAAKNNPETRKEIEFHFLNFDEGPFLAPPEEIQKARKDAEEQYNYLMRKGEKRAPVKPARGRISEEESINIYKGTVKEVSPWRKDAPDEMNIKERLYLIVEYEIESLRYLELAKKNPKDGESLFEGSDHMKKEWSKELEEVAAFEKRNPGWQEIIDRLMTEMKSEDFKEKNRPFAPKAIDATKTELKTARQRKIDAQKFVKKHGR